LGRLPVAEFEAVFLLDIDQFMSSSEIGMIEKLTVRFLR
jgi:hypothetical protein